MREYIFIGVEKSLVFISKFEEAIVSKYGLSDSQPYQCLNNFPNKGVIQVFNENIEYRYHGGGCTINSPSYEISYDIRMSSEKKYEMSFWSLFVFIKSYFPNSDEFKEDDFREEMEKLKKENLIQTTEFSEFALKLG